MNKFFVLSMLISTFLQPLLLMAAPDVVHHDILQVNPRLTFADVLQ